jgi:hypothetical protein
MEAKGSYLGWGNDYAVESLLLLDDRANWEGRTSIAQLIHSA